MRRVGMTWQCPIWVRGAWIHPFLARNDSDGASWSSHGGLHLRPPAGDGAWGRGARDLSGQIERGRGSCGRVAGTNAGALGSLLGRRICDLAVQNEWVVVSLVGGVDPKTRNEGDWLGGEHEE